MMKISRLLALFVLIAIGTSKAQNPLQLSQSQLVFSSTNELQKDSLTVTLTNSSPQPMNITVVPASFYGGRPFWVQDSVFTLAAGGQRVIKVYFQPKQNLLNNSELLFVNSGGKGAVTLDVRGQGTYSNSYYSTTQNLEGQALKQALNTRLALNYNSLGYNSGRIYMFGTLDNWQLNGREPGRTTNKTECVYTARTIENYPVNTGTLNNAPYLMNTEHTWPQSQGSDAEPMQSDLHHLYPSDGPTNSARGNKPFRWVTNPTLTYTGGSKADPVYFEPRDFHKGRVASSMLYYAVRYYNNSNVALSYLQAQESSLRDWLKMYPPDSIAIRRNNGVFSQQGNRNPFVDYPQLIDRFDNLSSATSSTPVRSSMLLTDSRVQLVGLVPNNVVYKVVVVNTGNQQLQLSNLRTTGQNLTVANNSLNVAPGESATIDLTYSGTSSTFTDTLLGSTNISGQSVEVVFVAAGGSVVVQMGTLLIPWAGSQIALDPATPQNLSFRWRQGSSNVSSALQYRLFIRQNSGSQIIASFNAGTDTTLAVSYSSLIDSLIGKGLSGIIDANWSVEASTAGISALSNEQRPIQFDLSLVSIPENLLSNLKIYPNPVGNHDILVLESPVPPVNTELFDSKGSKMMLNAERGTGSIRYPMNGLQSGIYFLKAHFPDGSVLVRKLMVLKQE